MKVCIVGGGHIGTTLACYIKYNCPDMTVSLYTRREEAFSEYIKCNDIERAESYCVKLDIISSFANTAAKDADIVFIALPHFAVEKAFSDISSYVSSNAFIGVLPGCGGCEFFFDKYFDSNRTLFGFQRVPFTSKLVEYGKETNLKSWKPFSVVGTLQRDRIDLACDLIERCGLKTQKASNYLEIALTPTNPILHTSRMYEIFGKREKDYGFHEKCKFFVGWTDEASKIMFAMDRELHDLLDQITELDTSAIRPLSEHYESPTVQDLTRKINSIVTFQTVYAPLKINQKGYYQADTSSRMFLEDFPWGLAIYRSYCKIFGIEAPTMDKLLKWYADYMGLKWYENGEFCGKDLCETGCLERYGIKDKEQLIACYLR